MIVLSASGPVDENAVVAVSAVVLWHVDVAAVFSVKSVLMSLLWAAVVQSDLVVVVHVLFLDQGLLHQVLLSFLACPCQQVMPSELVLSHT